MKSLAVLSFICLFTLCVVVIGGETQQPLVSVIIPTYGRPEFLKKAIELVRRQDYTNLEIVIVDDSPQPMELAVENNVNYIHLTSRNSIGAKRNLAVENSKGDIIVHWDDDDYFREHRIREQVTPIINGEADMTVLEHHYYFHLPSKSFFTVKRASSWGPHFGTFVYRKSLFSSGGIRYPDTSMAEDYAFAESALNQGASIQIVNNEDGKHVYTRHQNTWQFDFSDYDAQVARVERPSFFLQEDFDFFVNIESNALPPPPKHYASEHIKWNRAELHPGWHSSQGELDQFPTYPYYPHYPYYPSHDDGGLSTIAKIGIGVGVAGAVVLIVGVGISAYFYFQWRRQQEQGYTRINDVV